MNKGLNLPAIQRIMAEFEKESAMMDMKESVMSDVVDDVMDDELEDEEEEGDKLLKEVFDEIGVDLSQQVSSSSITTCILKDEVLTSQSVNGCAEQHIGRSFGKYETGSCTWRKRWAYFFSAACEA